MIATLATSCHVAVLDVETGYGLLRRPHPDADLSMLGPSLHWADWDAMMRLLVGHGWEQQEDDDGLPQHVADLGDGGELIALYGPAMRSEVDMRDLVRAHEALIEALTAL